MKNVKNMLILLLLACIVMAIAISLFAGNATGRADFEKWSNRSARVLEPANYNTKGTCSEEICTWKGVGGIGNMGIGNGNVSLMKPDMLYEMNRNATQAASGNESARETVPGNATAKNESATPANSAAGSVISAPAGNSPGNGTLVSGDIDAQIAVPEAAAEGPITESLYPDYDLAASVIPRGVPYSITVNRPFPNILAENPAEAAALYGKLIGFPTSGGQVVDIGIKCIGYEY